jgi:hypothetical protein
VGDGFWLPNLWVMLCEVVECMSQEMVGSTRSTGRETVLKV